MDELTNREREALPGAVNEIRTYKLLQAKGYERLAKKAKDERAKRLLVETSASESQDCEYWAEKIGELSGQRDLTLFSAP